MVCLETDAKHVHMYLLNLNTWSSEQQCCLGRMFAYLFQLHGYRTFNVRVCRTSTKPNKVCNS